MSTPTGLVEDIDEIAYHADRGSLSHSGAKLLHDCPARFRWEQEHRTEKDAYDLGTIAHRLILRSDDHRIRVADTREWKPWQTWNPWKDKVRAEGNVAIHRGQLLEASRMAAAVRRHPLASAILARPGLTEVSLYGTDPETGVTLRGRVDRLTDDAHGRPVIVDVKTTAMKGRESFSRKAFDYGYHTQAAWYSDLAVLAGVTDEPPAFVLVAVETEPPHFVHVHVFDEDALDIARAKNRRAIDLYAQCVATDEWPAYPPEVNVIVPPRWLS